MKLSFREVESSDIAEMLQLWDGEPYLGITDSDTQERLERYIEDNQGCCFLALDGEVIVGTILGGSDSRRVFLNHLFVKEGYRGKGIAAQLVELSESGARNYPSLRSYVMVYQENKNAIGFWEKQGYVQDKRLVILKKPLHSSVVV